METIWQKIADIILLSRLEKRWQKAASLLAIIVVFCTTYMLILPAITLANETYCGYDAHLHEDGCYVIEKTLNCSYISPESSEKEAEESEESTASVAGEVTSEAEETNTVNEKSTSETEETASEIEETASETEETASALEETTSETEETASALEETASDLQETESEATEEESAKASEAAHTHTQECFVDVRKLVCTLQEHLHNEDCFAEDSSSAEIYNAVYINNALLADNGIVPLAETESAERVDFDTLDGSGSTYYIVYTYHNGNYYALDGNGNAVAVTVGNNGTVTSNSMGNNLYWSFSFQSDSTYTIQNLGTSRYMHSYNNSSTDYGVTTAGAWTSSLETTGSGSSKIFRVKSNSNYSRIVTSGNRVVFQTTTSSSQAAQFYLAQVYIPQDTYHVWFDGTCGGLMSLYEAGNTYQAVPGDATTITLPATCESPGKYDYTLNGWYDINDHKYYKPGAQVTITKNTVFYADWIAKTYDVGQNNEHVVPSLDTNSFITTNMFDYSAVFNMQAVTHTGTISASGHSETWTIVQNANVPYKDMPSLGFTFRDWDTGSKHISYAGNRARLNDNQGTEITSQIIDYVYDMSGENIIDILFNPETEVIGKNYVGEANYLYQFMEAGSSNYDGIHNGYYYYDATLNAASYNQTDKRFYIYDYLERTSDSLKDSFDSDGNPTAAGAYSDFLPFNSPYVNNSNNKTIVDYADKNGKTGNYQYDAKSAHEGSSAENAGTNYWFGMKSEIQFYLPNDTGTVDAYGNYGNISTHGEHMNFQFHGDDDLWVFVDGELVMDVGGLHGIMNGKIDFSTGKITTDYAENVDLVATATETDINLAEGEHTLTIYYMERGGSQSNCAIYFNITPRYAMEIVKQDALSGEKLNGAEFAVFTDENCTVPAQLWNSEEDYQNDMPSTNIFTVKNGKTYFWGISAGKVYYIRETKAPDGYPLTDDIIRVAMNNLGDTVCTTDSLRGENESHTDGFDILFSDANEATQLLSIILTNQKETTEETGSTNVRVSKAWAENSENIPDSITVYLTADGALTGKSAALTKANDWTYTWTGLPKSNDGINDIVYSVREVPVPGFSSVISAPQDLNDTENWLKTDALRDGDTFIFVDTQSGNALSANSSSFIWITQTQAKNDSSAQWTSIADGMGFYLENGDGYRITLNGTSGFTPELNGNKILYYYNSKLFAQNGNVYYYFDSDALANSLDGLEFDLYKKSTSDLSGTLLTITNTPIPESSQTYLNVKKAWSDGDTEHINDSITVHLYADGKDTGRTLTLNRNNGWAGTFDGLLYLNSENGETINYTVTEDVFSGYITEYSEVVHIDGKQITEWLSTDTLTAGNIYMFTYNGYALACSGNNVVSARSDPDDAYQQWRVVQSGNNTVLQNVGNNRYLQYNRSFSTTASASSYCYVTFSGNKLYVRNRYVVLSSSGVSATTSSGSASTLTATVQTATTLNPGYEITVSNIEIPYLLPETGGGGTHYLYIIGGLLTSMSIVFILCNKNIGGRRRKSSKT